MKTFPNDDLSAPRGIMNALVVCIPSWIVIALVIWLFDGCVVSGGNSDGYSPEELRAAAQKMETVRGNLKTLDDVKGFLSFFEYQPQYSRHRPSAIEVFVAGYRGNCVGAAVLSQWALEVIGVKSRIWELNGGGWGDPHTVTVTEDKTLMITNDIIGYGGNTSIVFKTLNPSSWEKDVLGYFTPPYQTIERFKS